MPQFILEFSGVSDSLVIHVKEFSSLELSAYGVAAVLLLAMNAIFVATEFSLVKLRFTRFGTGKMKEARQNETVSRFLEDMGSSLKFLRLGISICSIGSAFLIIPLAVELCRYLNWIKGVEIWPAALLSFVVAVSVHVVLGELVPRALALQYPVQTLKGSLPLVNVFRLFTRPISGVLNWISAIVLKALRVDANMDLNLLDVEAQIRSLVSEGVELPGISESIVSNALELRKRVAHDIMIPRNQLQFIDTEDSVEENLEMARTSGHTRFPLCDGDLDHTVGIIHIKDVFRSGKKAAEVNWSQLKRPMIRFSMDEPLERVLQSFLLKRKHFALLTDEFEGTVGAVTLEDVLEELVGTIQDEFDREEVQIREREDGSVEVDGLTPLHDLGENLGIQLEADEVSTVGGYITYQLGRMPRLDESFRIGELEIVATAVDERRVRTAHVRLVASEEAEMEEES